MTWERPVETLALAGARAGTPATVILGGFVILGRLLIPGGCLMLISGLVVQEVVWFRS